MGSIVSGVGDIIGGNYQAAADDERASELKQQAKMQVASGEEAEAQRYNELNTTVGAIKALAGSRGINPNSGSAEAYQMGQRSIARQDASMTSINAQIGAGLDRQSAAAASTAAQGAQIGSWFQAIGAVDSGATQAFEAFG